MTSLRRRTLAHMQIKGFSESTIKSYIYRIQEFALYYNKCPSLLTEDHVIEYLRHLIEDRKLSKSTLSMAYSAIKVLFTEVLDKSWNKTRLPRVKRAKTLPIILSVNQVERLFEVTTNNKHKAILMLLYSSGLRVSEICHLLKKDVLVSAKLLFVRQSKGNKDRYTIISQRSLDQLALYRKVYRPNKWLFNGQDREGPLSISTVQSIYKKAKSKAGIIQQGGIHQLRHSFATQMISSGMKVHQLQKILGHSSIRTTMIYVHLSSEDLGDFEHPMDNKKAE